MADSAANSNAGPAIGEVQSVSGRAVAIGPNGAERQLIAGDTVYEGEVIRTLGTSSIVISLNDGTRFDLGRDAEALLDDTLLANDVPALRAEAMAEVAELQALIAAGADPTEIADATAAGGEPGGAADESIQGGVTIARTGRVGNVEAGYETGAPGIGFGPLVADTIDFGGDGLVGDTAADEFVPPTPVVSILVTSVAGDNVVNATEAASLSVPVTGTVGGDATDGDTVTVTVNGNSYTGIVSGGTFTVDVSGADLVADNTVTASITVTNAFGVATTATDSSITHTVSIVGTPAPTVTITEDTNDDGLISGSELSGDVDVEIGLPAGSVAGDTITVSDGTTTTDIVLTPADITAGSVTTSFPSPGEGNTITVTATLTDSAGNTSPSGADSATVDTTATSAPTVTITEDLNDDGLISGSELSGDIDVEVGLPAGAVAGDTISVSDGTTTTDIVLTPADITAGTVSTTFPSPGEGNTITVTATLTDAAGNTSPSASDSATIDTTATLAPTVTITEDANDDGLISGSELSGDIDIEIGLPAGAAAGDTISVSDGTTTTDIVLTPADITAGNVTTSFPSPGEGNTITVTATLTDSAGNTSPSGGDSATVDTLATPAPTVTIAEDTNDDGLISGSELSGDIDVEVGLPSGAVAGDTVTVSDGTTTTDIVLTPADITAGSVTTSFPSPGEGNTITVAATLTDAAGNTSPSASDSATVDTTATLAPTVTITEDTNDDGLISGSELSGDIDVQVGLPAGAAAGDTISVSDGTTTTDIVLTPADITAGSITTSFPSPGDGNTINVTATLTDAAGNTSPSASDSARVDTTATLAPTVTITEDTNNDGLVSGTELSGDIDVEVGLPVGAVAGDTVTVSDGTTTNDIVLTPADITAGTVTTSFPSPGEGNTITVTATLTDAAGNTSPSASDSATVDTTATLAPTVTITEDTNDDGFISGSELSGDIDVEIGLPAGSVAGDTITVTDGTTTTDIVLTPADITAGSVSTTFASPGEGNTITVTATLTDAAGNASPSASDSATVDTTATAAPTVTITEDTNDDGLISGSELSGDIDVQVGLPAGAVAGDTISVSDGTTTTDIVLTPADITAGSVTTSFPSPGDGNAIDVTATLTDSAGNTSPSANDSATVDTTAAPAPTVTITEDLNDDGLISGSELSGDIDVEVGLPAGAVAGDTITVTDGTTTTDIVLTPADITAGGVTTSFPSPGEGNTINVTATLTDAAGNTSPPATDSATIDTTATPAPTVTITEDTNDDGLISGSELSGDIDVEIGLPTGAVAGDTITVSDGTTVTDIVLTPTDITAGTVSTTFPSPGEGNTIIVTATLTDAAGNTSASASDSATVDTTATLAPTVTITEDTNDDGLISGGELSGDIDVEIGLPAGAVAGDTITVSDGTTVTDIVLTAADITAGAVGTTFPSPGEGNIITVTATLTDAAGNTSASANDSATVDTTATLAPTVTITEDVNDDGLISGSELSGDIDVEIGLPAGAVAGDTITVSDGTASTDIVLTPSDITAGSVTTSFPSPGEGNTITVTATLTDLAGNTSTSASDSATVDTTATPAPTVTITEDTNDDGLISGSELSGDVDVEVGLPAGAIAGDTISVSDGTTTTDIVLTPADVIAGSVTTSFPSPGEGNTITVAATLTDAAGNTSPSASDSATVDTTATPAPTVTITEDANDDGLISGSELSGDIDVEVGLPVGAVAGDTITVSDGTTTTDIVLTPADITAGSVTTSFPSPGEGNTITVTATLTDAAGNVSPSATDSATVDTTATAAPTITITEDTNDDGFISSSELSGDIDVEVGLPAGAVAGDTITVTDGTTTTDIVLTPADITAGSVTTTFASPGEGNTITVTATLTDAAGNVSPSATDSATVDTTATAAPTITITEDTNDDGFISSSELSGDIDVEVGLPAGAVAGDTISVSDGTTTTDIVLTPADITAGSVTTSFPSPGEGNTITVTAALTDAAGNTSPSASDSATVDTTATLAPTVTITEDTNNDGLISGSELSGDIDVEVGLPAGAVAGDTISVSDGTTTTDIVLTPADITAGTVSTTFPSPGEGNTITVTAALTDAAGNTSPSASDSATVDTTAAPAPTVTITEDMNDDGLISGSELSGDIDVEVGLPAGAVAGDTISVSDGTTTTDIVLTPADITAGIVSTTFPSPGEGNTITVTATLTDAAGNTSPSASDSATIDTTATLAPTVTITEDANDDGLISGGELSGNIDVEVGLPAGAVAGDTISVSDGTTTTDIVLTPADITAGTVSTTFPSPGEGNTITVTAALTDAAGNTSPSASDSATVDTTAAPAPTVTITEDTNDDGLISGSELSGDIDVEVGLPAGAVVGDTITVSDGTTTIDIVLTPADITAGSVATTFASPGEGNTINVTATLTDAAGNVSPSATDSATVDTTATAAPTVTIAEDANDDGLISGSELSGDIDVEVGLPAGAVAGDTITVSDGTTTTDIVLTSADITAGTVSTTFPSPGEGNTITVTATLTDAAGNTSPSASDSATVDTMATLAPTVTITEDTNDDGLISGSELLGDVDVEVGLPAGAVAGDTITVSDGTTTTDIVLTSADITAGTVATTFPSPGDGNTITVTAALTDSAGNTSPSASDSATVDTGATPAPTVTIIEDTNDDGLISSSELSGDIDVEVGLPAGAVAGDTISVSDGTTTTDIVLTPADITAGSVTTSFPSPGEANTITVTAALTDSAGNTSPSASDSATVDTGATPAPTVTIIEDTNDDGFISGGELSGDIDVEVGLPAGAVAGDTISVSDGTTTTDIVLTPADITAGTVSTTFPSPGDGNTITVTATLTDAAGNTSLSASDSATVDTTASPAPTVTITEDTNDDGLISASELSGDIDVEVGLPAGAFAGDTIMVSDGTTTTDIVLTPADVTAGSVTTSFPSPGEGNMITVTATLTDAAGNTSPSASDSATVDTTATLAPTVTITEDVNDDGLISGSELSGDIDVEIGLPAGAVAGDTITVSDGTASTDIVLTPSDLTAGSVTASFPSPGEGNIITVTATLTDAAGNTSPSASDSATVDTGATPAPTVTITEDLNDDGLISGSELSGDIDVEVGLPAGAVAGDTVTVSDGTTVTDIVLTPADITAGTVSTTFPSPGEGNTITVTATLTDAAGNTSPSASDSATIDTTATLAPTVTITEDTNDDGLISGGELSGDIDVEIGLPADAVAGDTISVSDGTTTTDIVLTPADITAGIVSTTFPSPGEGNTITVTATLTDAAGNTSPSASDSATVDTTATLAPTVTITEDTNDDGFISGIELSGDIDVEVGLPAGAVVGDTITVSDGTTTIDIVLTPADITAGSVATTFASPGEGNTINVTATLTDAAGNVSPSATDSATVDMTATAAPTITITEDTNDDGFISSSELSGDIDVEVGLPAGAVAGDTISVSDGTTTTDIVLTPADITAGSVTTSFPSPGEGNTINVTATLMDAAGNTSPSASDSATVDTTATLTPTVTITEDTNDDGLISGSELSGDIDVEVSLPAGAVAGDTITVSDGTTTTDIVLTPADITAGSVTTTFASPGEGNTITVTATLTDSAGNTSPSASDSATVDTTATLAPTVTITEDANDDGLISASELSGDIDVEVGIPAGAVAGDKITVSDGTTTTDIVLTPADITAGTVSTIFPSPGESNTITVTATLTDSAGNASPSASDSATVDTTATLAPTVTITEDVNDDGLISGSELSGDIDVEIGLPAGAVAGDTITVSDGTASIDIVLTPSDITAGSVTTSFPSPGEGNTITVTATLTDAAGNASPSASDSAVIDTIAANLPPIATDDPGDTPYSISVGTFGGNNWSNVDSTGTPVSLVARDIDGSVASVYAKGIRRGVAGSPRSTGQVHEQIEYDRDSGQSESLALEFAGNLDTAEFSVDRLFATENGGEQGRWVALYDGEVVASDTFVLTSGVSGTFAIDTGGRVFNEVRFEGIDTVDGGGDGSDYFVTGFEGSGPAGANSAYTTNADTVLTITAASPNDLIDNDSDPDADPLTVVEINGNPVADGEIVVLPSGALLTINADGSFSYDPNDQFDTLAVGELASDSFEYTVSDGNGGEATATATVTNIGVLNVTLTLDGPITADDMITPDELGDSILISGSVTGVSVGEEVTVTINGTDYPTTVAADGSFSVSVLGSELAADSDNAIEASVTVRDVLGNEVSASDIEGYAVANAIPAASQVLAGEFYAYNDRKVSSGWETNADDRSVGNLDKLSDILAIIDGRAIGGAPGASVVGTVDAGSANAAFASTRVNYGQIGGHLGNSNKLQSFLGGDAASLSRDPANATDGIIRIFGYLLVESASMDFRVRSDDGFLVRIGDATFGVPTNHSPQTDTFDNVSLEPGLQEIEILYWDQGGDAVLQIEAKAADAPDADYAYLGSDDFGLFEPGFIDGLGDDVRVVEYPADSGTYVAIEPLTGSAGVDHLEGSDGLDILVGGAGDDLLTGGAGADVFVWNAGDQGVAGAPSVDTVTDFSLDEGDALDLADLLSEEISNPLTHFLSFEASADGNDTLVHISSDGGFAGGYSAAAEDQTIVLEGVNLTTLGGTDQLIINALLDGNHLIVDV